MTRQGKRQGPGQKEIRAWGVRRHDVDINQLALAYYLLARIRLEQDREATTAAAPLPSGTVAALVDGSASEAA